MVLRERLEHFDHDDLEMQIAINLVRCLDRFVNSAALMSLTTYKIKSARAFV